MKEVSFGSKISFIDDYIDVVKQRRGFMSLILSAIKFKQGNTQMYVATVPINKLESFSIDIWDPKNVMRRRGYQRKPDEKRIKKIAKYFEREDAIMPVAGLLNIREKGRVKFKSGKLTIPDGIDVWVVDMQHRLKGLVEAKDQGLLKSDNFVFPVVITEGLNLVSEAAQFYIINTKAKKMNVALTRRLLIENEMIKDVAEAKPWEIAAVMATIDLNSKISRENPWFGAIRQPNEEKRHPHIATEKSFVSSLRQIFITGRHKQPHKIAKRMAKFWWAVRANIPEAFTDPRKFLIQRTAGMFAFNFFIAPVFLSKYKDKDFITMLKGLKIQGADFWKRSNKNGVRRFGTGMGGYSNLAEFIKAHLK
ncbi:DGQHR domain-containing protein [Candidatus Omnitrophota bacterium]